MFVGRLRPNLRKSVERIIYCQHAVTDERNVITRNQNCANIKIVTTCLLSSQACEFALNRALSSRLNACTHAHNTQTWMNMIPPTSPLPSIVLIMNI